VLITNGYGNSKKPLRYVIYARKSSEDVEAQAKSLPDQIADCEEYALRHNLKVVGKPIQESKSAKKSGNRPLFTQMLKDIESGKFDGIIAWHPDRLARNMLEAGMIVDMVDNDVIKDLQFPTHPFTNNASGKLNLNIQFALSKQYSEHLSESVQRGMDSNLEQGKSSGVPKWGYTRSEITGFYEPNENFYYIQEGWKMRLEGSTIAEILEYWRAHDVHRITKITRKNKTKRRIEISDKMATSIFRDPFYYGILVQSGTSVDLRELNPNFKPMISESDYNAVQELTRSRTRRNVVKYKQKGHIFLPFRQFIKCRECGRYMYISRSRGYNGTYYLNARCENKECSRKPRAVRVKVILEEIYKALGELKFDEKDYNRHLKDLKEYVDVKLDKLIIEKRSLLGAKRRKQAKINEHATTYSKFDSMTPEIVKQKVREQIEMLQEDLINIEQELAKVESQIIDPEGLKMNQEKFLNSLNMLEQQMRARNPVGKDLLAREIFLNWEIDQQNRVFYRYKDPIELAHKYIKSTFGAPD